MVLDYDTAVPGLGNTRSEFPSNGVRFFTHDHSSGLYPSLDSGPMVQSDIDAGVRSFSMQKQS